MRARSRLIRVILAFAIGTILAVVARRAPASDDSAALLARAWHEDEAFSFREALAHFDEAVALDPSGATTPRAVARAATLRAHAEGDFAPYVALERLRRDPKRSSDARAVDALVHDAEAFPPGLVRIEVWVLAAEAYSHRFDRPRDAEPLLVRLLGEPLTDPVIAQQAARDLVTLRFARDDLDGAREAVRLAGARADPRLASDVGRMGRRHWMHIACIAIVLLMVLLALRSWARAAKRGAAAEAREALARTWKIAVGYAIYVALGGALLAYGYEPGTTKPFLFFGVALVPVLLVARAWGAAGGAATAARAGRAVVCSAAALGAAYLVLESIDVVFLASMGL